MKKRILLVSLVIVSLLTLTYALNFLGYLDIYNADSNKIGKIKSYPTVYAKSLVSGFGVFESSYVPFARSQWSNAGITTLSSSSEYSADIPMYGGTYEQLNAIDSAFKSNYGGLMSPTYTGTSGYYYEPINTRTIYKKSFTVDHVLVKYIPNLYMSDVYHKSVTLHEFTHALGYFSHSTNPNDVMYYQSNRRTSLSTNEKLHLTQIW